MAEAQGSLASEELTSLKQYFLSTVTTGSLSLPVAAR